MIANRRYQQTLRNNLVNFKVLALLLFSLKITQQVINQCDSTMKFCDSTGYFNSIIKPRLFEGSIGLYQSAFYNNFEETTASYLASNPSNCVARGFTESQQQIIYAQQVGNILNNHDGNTNPDTIHYYDNSAHAYTAGLQQFIGNVISFPTCSYVFNFVYNPVTLIKTYNIERFTISIEYDSTINKKQTTHTKQYSTSFSKAKTFLSYFDFPCQNTEFYYHPGISAIVYFSDDGKALNVIADTNFASGGDPCQTNLFADSSKISQYQVTLSDSALSAFISPLKYPVFLNKEIYIVTYQKNSGNAALTDSIIWKLKMATSPSISSAFTQVKRITTSTIDQIAAFELTGLVYTISGSKGYNILYLDKTSYVTEQSVTSYQTSDFWKIYQSRVDNHMHRPIWGVKDSDISSFYRITTQTTLTFTDASQTVDLYNFKPQFARFHALVLNAGACGSARDTPDYNKMRGQIINLRTMTLENCFDLTNAGCGNGKKYLALGEECDDGNLEDDDGCSSTCTIEPDTKCTTVEGALSVCVPLICGNGKSNTGEQCDDSNQIDGDGCSSTCLAEAGYDCSAFFSCTPACGDGKILQLLRTDALGVSYEFFREVCDGVQGCVNATCQPTLGWTCTQDVVAQTSQCTMTCGNNAHETWEICDDLNNDSGDGCAQGCMVVETGYKCPQVGKCFKNCGDGSFGGVDSIHGITGTDLNEECDDGNDLDGDGCSNLCLIEVGWTCVQVFDKLTFEKPSFKTKCTKNAVTVVDTNVYSYYRTITQNTELNFYQYRVFTNSPSGKFRLIESGEDEKVYGICYFSTNDNYMGTGSYTRDTVDYCKIKQKVSGAYTYYENLNNDVFGRSRGMFGKYLVSLSPVNKQMMEFYALSSGITGVTAGDIMFEKFTSTSASNVSPNLFEGSHEVYWWPYMKQAIAKYRDGFNWKAFGFTKNVIGYAQTPASYPDTDRIEDTLQRVFNLDGSLVVPPLFYSWYIFTYVNKGSNWGYFRVHKYYKDFDYLAPFNEELQINEPQLDSFRLYSLVYFDSEFGVVLKQYNSNTIYRFLVSTMSQNSGSSTLNDNGLVHAGFSLKYLTMIQRRQDPDNPEEDGRDVWGYFSNQPYLYRIVGDSAANQIKVVEQVVIPSNGIQLSDGYIDIGKYQIAVYSGQNCGAVKGTTLITNASVLFYTFSTKLWSCMDLNNPTQTPASNGPVAWIVTP
eukprot:403336851